MSDESIEVSDPWKRLGIAEDADDAAIRQAYLRCVKDHPPSRDPETAEQIRAAYEQLKDPLKRAERAVLYADPEAPLVSLLEGCSGHRAFVGPELWLNVLKK